MERLTYRDSSVPHPSAFDGKVVEAYSDYDTRELINRLAAYEDTGLTPDEVDQIRRASQTMMFPTVGDFVRYAIQNFEDLEKYRKAESDGRLFVLPCKIGDVLDLRKRDDIEADFGTVYHIEFWEGGTIDVWFWIDPDTVSHVEVSDFGKTVFLAQDDKLVDFDQFEEA